MGPSAVMSWLRSGMSGRLMRMVQLEAVVVVGGCGIRDRRGRGSVRRRRMSRRLGG